MALMSGAIPKTDPKNYILQEGQYLIRVRVFEASDLISRYYHFHY